MVPDGAEPYSHVRLVRQLVGEGLGAEAGLAPAQTAVSPLHRLDAAAAGTGGRVMAPAEHVARRAEASAEVPPGQAAVAGVSGLDVPLREAHHGLTPAAANGCGDPAPAPPAHGGGAATWQGQGSVHSKRPGLPGRRRCCIGRHGRCCASRVWWYAPSRCCASIAALWSGGCKPAGVNCRTGVDLESAATALRSAGVRTVLSLSSRPPGHRERPAAAPVAHADHRSGTEHRPRHTKTRSPRRHPPRIPAYPMTCTDGISGKCSSAWHTIFRREPPVDCLATALQSRIRHSRPGSDLSAGGRQGALPRLDAGRSQRPGRPRATCLRKPTQRHHRQSPHPCRMGSATPCSHPERRSGADKGPYASRCREHPNRPGDPRGLRLTTAHRGAVRHRTSTGSGDGQTGRR